MNFFGVIVTVWLVGSLIAVATPLLNAWTTNMEANCTARGGSLHYVVGTGLGLSAINLCLSPDGRILRP